MRLRENALTRRLEGDATHLSRKLGRPGATWLLKLPDSPVGL
jgi:hypothetical protein